MADGRRKKSRIAAPAQYAAELACTKPAQHDDLVRRSVL
ncbi:hypothetical protein ALP99_101221 [Pseudomonas syringae pv. tomato]|uniref:Uncharacterized protein n=6 Tax=Pseudomonas syringae group TaxID=136849 RepID=A0A0Q0FY75_PSESX|nr:hypothetical protein PSPTO_2027 [Pseudomonas syringae pv. tomato str. DC3000]KPC09874.1 Uncharacterized protein AC506_4275 [Pseudomonas syringae pv. maculicola str. M6]KPW39926.1 hypothetical protein ALO87_101208 [Pseudomonas syringae pv. apii]KPW47997.1 Uncharacterized protein ALO88_05426 [Pseudomonas syringae pv. antirrhini]KPW57698.1 Uncharacterized protein ALO86_04708 [Pseudomonas syringae pv. berberidis]KPX72212.1 hypothetical protein ALO84_101050 [Pseudomonas syringae pv. maculicola]